MSSDGTSILWNWKHHRRIQVSWISVPAIIKQRYMYIVAYICLYCPYRNIGGSRFPALLLHLFHLTWKISNVSFYRDELPADEILFHMPQIFHTHLLWSNSSWHVESTNLHNALWIFSSYSILQNSGQWCSYTHPVIGYSQY